MKKVIALLLCAVALVGLLAGCNKNKADETTLSTEYLVESTPAGTLYLTFGAMIEVVYDADGNALHIAGKNDAGKTIANACQNQLNQDCVFAARAMLRYASDNKLFGDAKTVAVRLGKNDPMPTTDFLETIITDCQYLLDEECTGLKMIRISDERLDEDSRLNLDCAKILASYYLGAPTSELSGGEVPLDGVYTITTADGKSCTVDAFNGLVVGK